MEPIIKEARYYVAPKGKSPCENWLNNLRDRQGRAIIRARIRRLELGNHGEHRYVGHGVWELKISFGPGYRVYYGEDGDRLVILLLGGDKSTQNKDIKKAQDYWSEYLGGHSHETFKKFS